MITSSIITALTSTSLPIALGAYTGTALNYIVITGITERNDDIADDTELTETSSADINLYYVGDFTTKKTTIETSLKAAGFFIADRLYIECDSETEQHHFVFTVELKEVI